MIPTITLTPTTREDFWAMLGAVPPARRKAIGFLVGEPYSDRVCQVAHTYQVTYHAYFQIGEHFFDAGPLTMEEFETVTAADLMKGVAA